jgi:hypothetical protein
MMAPCEEFLLLVIIALEGVEDVAVEDVVSAKVTLK